MSLARRRFPGAPASLDALCKRFSIDLSARDKHGAEIDCGLLAAVYIELLGGRKPGLDFVVTPVAATVLATVASTRPMREPRRHVASDEELIAHAALLQTISNPLWLSER